MLCFTALDLIGRLLAGTASRGITYLAVGTGEAAWDGAPPPPDRSRTALVHELYRVRLRAGAELTYEAGAVGIRVSLGPGVATGPLREVGLFGGDATAAPGSGLLVMYKVHDRIDKAEADTVDREIRLELPAGLLPGARDLVGGLLAGTPGLAGVRYAALGSDGSAPAEPPTALVAEAYRTRLGPNELRYDPATREVVATLTVPFTQGPPVVAEAGLFGGGATAAEGSGLLVQRQTFDPVDRRIPRPLVRRFVLSLVAATPVTVPDVTGSSLDAARADLVAAGLVAGDLVLTDGGGAAAGTVIAQDPVAGTSVAEATRVRLTVAAEVTVPVPGVLGLPLATATAALTAAGLVAGDPLKDETDAPRGTVVAVRPPAATPVVPGTVVTLTVASPRVRAVPEVLGRTPAAADVLLRAAGFILAKAPHPVVESGSTVGTVVAQNPLPRARAPVDRPVRITLAAPFGVEVPDLRGRSPDDAAVVLRAAAAPVLAGLNRPPDPPGLAVGSTSERPAAAGEAVGTIVGQTPAAGARVPLYAAVAVVVAGASSAPVPDLTGLELGAAGVALSSAGFALGAVGHRAAETGVGTVVDQDPDPGRTWPPGGRVAVSLAVPVTVLVPDVVGLDQAAAAEGLASRGLVLGPTTPISTGPGTRPGQVLEQQPVAGSVVDKGSAVALTVAEGMPNLVGRTRDDAVAAVMALGLVASVRESPSTQPAGTVIEQVPSAGSATTAGQTVEIVVAVPPPVTVPDVVGLPFPAAQRRMSRLGLVLVAGGSREDASMPEGAVLELEPPAGSTLPQGSAVTATLAVAPPVIVNVPSLIDRSLTEARSLLADAGLAVAVKGSRPVPGTPADTVLEQDPVAGTPVRAGSTVSVVVASVDTSVLVPDLRSLGEDAARVTARNAGLSVVVAGTSLSLGPGGIVLSQDPLPNSRVPAGATVNVVLSQAAVRVPGVVGQDVGDAASQLQDLGLVVRTTPRRVVGRDMTVLTQTPAAGTVVAVGSTVVLVYAVERFPERPLPERPVVFPDPDPFRFPP
jgi:beta-lactam-binding protein with PASTA domain